jgi:adenine-specific DNA methylase
LPNEANWDYLVESSAVAETAENDQKFGTTLTHIWQECNRVLTRPHGRLIFTYHHWNPSAWAQLAIALIKARFVLTNAFVVHSENPISVHIRNLRALKHDTILVLKPLPDQTERRWEKPKPISTSDSYSFCRACGQMLGWVLDNDLSDQTILQAWSDFFKG